MRTLVVALVVALAAGASASAALAACASASASPRTSLTMTVWPEGAAGPSRTWTLRCAPARGTLPGRAAACRRLARLADPFRPVPPVAICTQIYGGPQVARVRGTFRGRRVWAEFSRRDGCEISRWDRVRFLLPRGDDA